MSVRSVTESSLRKKRMFVKAQCMRCNDYLEQTVGSFRTKVKTCKCKSSSFWVGKDRTIHSDGFIEIKLVRTRLSKYNIKNLIIGNIPPVRQYRRLCKPKLFNCTTCGDEIMGITIRKTCFSCKEKRNRKEAYKYFEKRNGLITTEYKQDDAGEIALQEAHWEARQVPTKGTDWVYWQKWG